MILIFRFQNLQTMPKSNFDTFVDAVLTVFQVFVPAVPGCIWVGLGKADHQLYIQSKMATPSIGTLNLSQLRYSNFKLPIFTFSTIVR